MPPDAPIYETEADWANVAYPETAQFREVYGFAGGQGLVHLEGVRYRPKDVRSETLLIYMHPATTLQLLPMPRAMAAAGAHVLCAGSRYAKNDTSLIMEKVVLDLGAWVRHAKEVWGYAKIVLVGWSGGGSLALLYQAQAEKPSIVETPAGDPVDIAGAGLIPADATIVQAAHLSRAVMLSEWIDPSVLDENDPDRREIELDLYDSRNPNKPPYSADYVAQFRAAQLARVRRRTDWVKETLDELKRRGGAEVERGFVTHRTMAEPRFLDVTIEPNDRAPGACFVGPPETANSGPAGVARFSTLRAWLSQWSVDDTNALGDVCAKDVTVPLLAIENTADDAVPQPHVGRIHDLAASADKTFVRITGANHYYAGQPELLRKAVEACAAWLRAHDLLNA